MNIRILKGGDLLPQGVSRIIPVAEGETPQLPQDTEAIFAALQASEQFSGKYGQLELLRLPQETILLLGTGKPQELTLEKGRRLAGKAVKAASKAKLSSLALELPESSLEPASLAAAMVEGALLADYSFDKYKSEAKPSPLQELLLLAEEDVAPAVEQGTIMAEAALIARNLVNEPTNKMGPAEIAQAAQELGSLHGFGVKVLQEAEIQELGMEAFLSVARAAHNRPVLIVMEHMGDPASEEKTALVGKGLMYDSGGLSIKPSDGMVTMKCDMAGAAAVVGAMTALARLKVKANVVGVIAACENMISGNSYRPGDIIGSMAGKTIEVMNTDAEGRLTLADAVYYAVENLKADRVVDVATLTGAAIVALGNITTPVITNNQEFYGKLEEAAKISGERFWQLPNDEDYLKLIKADNADLRNTASLPGNSGTITGGLFIGEFVQKKPWLHLDIAGTAWTRDESDYSSKGGTGTPVRTLVELVKLV